MRVTLVVAVSRNNVIGRNGALPWKLSSDLKRFRALTLGKPIIMGRKTFESIGRPLPGRTNIVVTRARLEAPELSVAPTFEDALRLACQGGDEVMIIGGAQIYQAALPVAGRIHFTRVAADFAGDAFFPQLTPADWLKTAAGGSKISPRDDYSCQYFVLDRRP